MATVNISVFPALIVALASLAVALISLIGTRSNQTKLLAHQAELSRYQGDLKRLQAELDEKKAERDARRDYEYEARKRLYHECSPLLFQFSEQAAAALARINGLAESAVQGNLGSGPDSWLTSRRYRYYRMSTEYRLLAPLATFSLLQRRLTHLDLSLDPDIYLVYVLARQASRVLADDFELAKLNDPSLQYEPHKAAPANPNAEDASIYVQQGVPKGILENAIEALLIKDGETNLRVMSFREFESALSDPSTVVHASLTRIRYLLEDFHPGARPVLWRLLLATASIYRAIGVLAEQQSAPWSDLHAKHLLLMPDEQKECYNWRLPNDTNSTLESAAAFTAVEAYLVRELERPIERITRTQRTA